MVLPRGGVAVCAFARVRGDGFRAIFRQSNDEANTWSLIEWIRMAMASKVPLIKNFARGIRDKFNDIINSFRYHINSARIEAMNADINRVQARCCGLFDLRYLFLKLRQFYFLRSILFYVKPRRVLQQN
ncbi:MAG: transposase [Akkermansiaceae bacterium]|nr:transposase [Akkermansiaceae bacterium]